MSDPSYKNGKRFHCAAGVDSSHLKPGEIELFDRYADSWGRVRSSDIEFLLRKITHMRLLFGELVANAGYPTRDSDGRYWAPVRAEDLDRASQEAVFDEEHVSRDDDAIE